MTSTPPAATVDELMALLEGWAQGQRLVGARLGKKEGRDRTLENELRQEADEIRDYAKRLATAAVLAARPPDWQPIATAPKGRTLLVGYPNRAGKWRTIRAHYYLSQTLELSDDYGGDDDGFAPEGWYEECENSETINFTEHDPTHWMELPAPPGAAAPPMPTQRELDMAMLIRKMAYSLSRRDAKPLADQAMHFLSRHGLQGSPLRESDAAHPPVSPTESASRPVEQERALPTTPDLHAAIMNLPSNHGDWSGTNGNMAYKTGHRDARHAAAELVAARALPEEAARLTDACRDVLAERQRQVEAEGWTPEHDDQHDSGAMAIAGACYALWDAKGLQVQTVNVGNLWQWTGWGASWFKPKDKRRNRVRAAALLLAEIERDDRAAIAAGPTREGEQQ